MTDDRRLSFIRARLESGEGGYRVIAQALDGLRAGREQTSGTSAESVRELREQLEESGLCHAFDADGWGYFWRLCSEDEQRDEQLHAADVGHPAVSAGDPGAAALDPASAPSAAPNPDSPGRAQHLEDLLRQGIHLMPAATGLQMQWITAAAREIPPL